MSIHTSDTITYSLHYTPLGLSRIELGVAKGGPEDVLLYGAFQNSGVLIDPLRGFGWRGDITVEKSAQKLTHVEYTLKIIP